MSSRPISDSDHLVCVATIVAAHGIRGEVKIRTYTEIPESIEDYPLWGQSKIKEYHIQIRQIIADDMVIASIEGIDNRNQAELLRQTHLYVERHQLPDIDDNDEFYHTDLIGLMVHNESGQTIGSVVALHNFGAGDIIELSLNGQEQTVMLPFSKQVVPHIDIAHHFLVVHFPETHDAES